MYITDIKSIIHKVLSYGRVNPSWGYVWAMQCRDRGGGHLTPLEISGLESPHDFPFGPVMHHHDKVDRHTYHLGGGILAAVAAPPI